MNDTEVTTTQKLFIKFVEVKKIYKKIIVYEALIL